MEHESESVFVQRDQYEQVICKTYQMYLNNVTVHVVDQGDQTKRFEPLLFGREFRFLLESFKK